jgi:hypothetical protein
MFTFRPTLGSKRRSSIIRLAKGLVAQWKFEEGVDTTVGDSIGSNDGTAVGGMTWETGKCGSFAGGFDGSDDYVTMGTGEFFDFPDSFTIAAWVKTSTTGVDQSVFSNFNNAVGNGYICEVGSTGTVRFRLTAVNVTGVIDIADGNWHHISCVRDAANNLLLLYVDGILDSTNVDEAIAYGAGYPVLIGGSYDHRFGDGYPPNFNTEPFNGDIDDVRVYDRAINAHEATALAVC